MNPLVLLVLVASPPHLTWDPLFEQWSSIEVSPTQRLSLEAVAAQSYGLLEARDAELVVGDVTGDGVDDWSMRSATQDCWAFWPSRTGEPVVSCPICQQRPSKGLSVCSGANVLANSKTLITVFRNGLPVQSIDAPDYGPTGQFELRDVTFDGRVDLLVPLGGCTGNCWHSVWRGDAQGRFVEMPALAKRPNLRVYDAKRHLLDATECNGQGCAVFTAQLLEVKGLEVRVVAEATQNDASPGSLKKVLRVTTENRLVCEAWVEPTERGRVLRKKVSGRCEGWAIPALE